MFLFSRTDLRLSSVEILWALPHCFPSVARSCAPWDFVANNYSCFQDLLVGCCSELSKRLSKYTADCWCPKLHHPTKVEGKFPKAENTMHNIKSYRGSWTRTDLNTPPWGQVFIVAEGDMHNFQKTKTKHCPIQLWCPWTTSITNMA